MVLPRSLETLHSVAQRAAERFERSADGVFDPCGLILELPPKQKYYWCTPDDALTFASTGGDGVHYSFFPASVGLDADPIVMTLPAADKHNVVVAESFGEFFSLGYHVGWFALEQIVYEPQDAVEYFSAPETNAPDYKRLRMQLLREELCMKHVPLSIERVSALTAKYEGLLAVPDGPHET